MILGPVAEANIDVDVIIQNVSHEGKTDFCFTVHAQRLRADDGADANDQCCPRPAPPA